MPTTNCVRILVIWCFGGLYFEQSLSCYLWKIIRQLEKYTLTLLGGLVTNISCWSISPTGRIIYHIYVAIQSGLQGYIVNGYIATYIAECRTIDMLKNMEANFLSGLNHNVKTTLIVSFYYFLDISEHQFGAKTAVYTFQFCSSAIQIGSARKYHHLRGEREWHFRLWKCIPGKRNGNLHSQLFRSARTFQSTFNPARPTAPKIQITPSALQIIPGSCQIPHKVEKRTMSSI